MPQHLDGWLLGIKMKIAKKRFFKRTPEFWKVLKNEDQPMIMASWNGQLWALHGIKRVTLNYYIASNGGKSMLGKK